MAEFFEILKLTLWNMYLVLAESGWFILGGLAVAGLIHVFLSPAVLHRWLGGNSIRAVFNASALGVPLPLCSCSVIPVATGLKKQGASNPAISAFLISTPENGVDSISISWALLGPWLTVARVVTSFITAMAAGIAMLFLGKNNDDPMIDEPAPASCCAGKKAESEKPQPAKASCCSTQPVEPEKASCCGGTDVHAHHNHDTPEKKDGSWFQRFLAGQRYAFGDLFPSLANYYWWGLLATGLIAALIPPGFIEKYAGDGFLSMVLMLVIGIPIYVCASGSTPLVAGLLAKGLSPGAALVFLMAGPATNIATMAVVRGLMKTRGLVIYLASISVCSLGFGLLINQLAKKIPFGRPDLFDSAEHMHFSVFSHVGAVIFLLMLIKAMLPRRK